MRRSTDQTPHIPTPPGLDRAMAIMQQQLEIGEAQLRGRRQHECAHIAPLPVSSGPARWPTKAWRNTVAVLRFIGHGTCPLDWVCAAALGFLLAYVAGVQF